MRRSRSRHKWIPLNPLKNLKPINTKERELLDAVDHGDRATVERMLFTEPLVDINCTNVLGRTPLFLAVDNENSELVRLLLRHPNIIIGDSLLQAIKEGVYGIVEQLINHPTIEQEILSSSWPGSEASKEIDSPEFRPDISPVMLAAICNQFEILQLLLSRGATIEQPHPASCHCHPCQESIQRDTLRHSLRRISTYRALASPAWICLTSQDPILDAFKLSVELSKLSSCENEFKETYLQLSDQCKGLACDLLEECRSNKEVICILNKSNEKYCHEKEILSFKRLKLAIKFEQKHFVAHPHCQKLLNNIWYNSMPEWSSPFTRLFLCLGIVILLPILAPIYLVYPQGKLGTFLRSPLVKFINHSASFAIFLALILIASAHNESEDIKIMRFIKRGPEPSLVEGLIVWWVIGFVWSEVKQIWEEGSKAYTRQWWNWLDFIMLCLYLCTVSLRIAALWLRLSQKYGHQDLPRTSWPSDDPTLISEALFSIAIVFSFARIIFLFQINEHLGPLQISLGKMLIDIIKFAFIFLLVITSFACGLHQLYYYFLGNPNIHNNQFGTLVSTYKNLYWNMFGVSSIPNIDIKVNDTRVSSARITVAVAEFLLLVYHSMTVIVLINMFIAMMSNSFQTIHNHADIEWKYARSKLWIGYFDEGCTLPPPLNTLISSKWIYRLCVYFLKTSQRFVNFLKITYRKFRGELINDITSNNKIAKIKPKSFNSQLHPSQTTCYQDVIRSLVTRYIFKAKKSMRQDGVSEDDLLEIKQDISSLRFELRDKAVQDDKMFMKNMQYLRKEIMKDFQKSQVSQGFVTDITSITPDAKRQITRILNRYHYEAMSEIDKVLFNETKVDSPSGTNDLKNYFQSLIKDTDV